MSDRAQVLVSACLLGQRVRYDGEAAERSDAILDRWRTEGRIVPVCPEVAAGLGVPRPPAEIAGGGGTDVLDGEARVGTRDGLDVTRAFLVGAEHAVQVAARHGLQVAVLKERSPSCGSAEVYDGSFSGEKIPGDGVTTALLRRHGVEVFGESQLADADARLRELDADPAG